MLKWLDLAFQLIRSLIRTQASLRMENLVLRQQLAVLKEKKPRPHLSRWDRIFWITVFRSWKNWWQDLIIVRPDTVVGWHKAGFRAYWRQKSKKRGRPPIRRHIRELILKMASENTGWGAPRIHSELLAIGFRISERTISRYLAKNKPAASPESRQRWMTFLRNHREAISAMDFFTVPTATFRVLYVLFFIHHDRRRILHFNVTEHPSAVWIIR